MIRSEAPAGCRSGDGIWGKGKQSLAPPSTQWPEREQRSDPNMRYSLSDSRSDSDIKHPFALYALTYTILEIRQSRAGC